MRARLRSCFEVQICAPRTLVWTNTVECNQLEISIEPACSSYDGQLQTPCHLHCFLRENKPRSPVILMRLYRDLETDMEWMQWNGNLMGPQCSVKQDVPQDMGRSLQISSNGDQRRGSQPTTQRKQELTELHRSWKDHWGPRCCHMGGGVTWGDD